MKNGDISNQTAPLVLIRLEDTILFEQNKTLKDKVRNLIVGKLHNSLVDVGALSYAMKLSKDTEYTVSLGLDKKAYIKPSTFNLSEFYIETLDGIDHIKFLLESRIIDYYLDENKERISLLSNDRAMSIDDFRHISGVK